MAVSDRERGADRRCRLGGQRLVRLLDRAPRRDRGGDHPPRAGRSRAAVAAGGSRGLPTAIAMYTINAAYANQQERETGSIEMGKLADLVVLERNLFEVEPREIHAVRVVRTILEGETVFEWVQ